MSTFLRNGTNFAYGCRLQDDDIQEQQQVPQQIDPTEHDEESKVLIIGGNAPNLLALSQLLLLPQYN